MSNAVEEFTKVKDKYERSKIKYEYAEKNLRELKKKAKAEGINLKTLNKAIRENEEKSKKIISEIEINLKDINNELG